MKLNKKWIIVISILVLIIVARLLLPYFVTKYVNKTLAEIQGYNGSISEVDIALIRGAYSVHDLKIEKEGSEIKVPFVNIKTIDLSLQWEALFKGKIVGEVALEKPELNFAVGPNKDDKQDGSEADWKETINDFMPLNINRFEVNNGKIAYHDFSTKPQVNVFLHNLNLIATNLGNVEQENDTLPSSLELTGTSIGKGDLSLKGRMNVLKTIPDFDMNLKFMKVNLTSFNEFAKAYGKFDIEKGTMDLVSEARLLDGTFDGYVKPLLKDVQILDLREDVGEKSAIRILWETILETGKEIFENEKKEQVATVIPIKGNIKDTQTEVWPTIMNVLRNAFVKAFSTEFESQLQSAKED